MTELVVLQDTSPERDYPAVPSVISGNDNHPPVDSVTSGNDNYPAVDSVTSGNDNYPAVDSVTSGNDNSAKRSAVHCRGATTLGVKTVQFRLAAKTCSIQKKSLLRSGRKKNTSVSRGRKSSVALVSKFYSPKHDSNLLDPMAYDSGPKSRRKSSKPSIKELRSSLDKDIGSLCCSGNILVIERYKGHRVEGAIVQLEGSASERWSLSIKKDGITQYSLTPGKAMRPCGYNHFTHDIIWTEDARKWKLEFLDRREWLIFRELYRECYDRNKLVPIADIVHIPGVYEVSDYADTESNSIPFRRPNSYISMEEDELSRALAKQRANYEMDSEDEEWLRKFNDESLVVNEYWEHVSDQHFEVIIDALEKASYLRPEDFSDERAAANLCLDLERKEVVEAIHGYWMQKRKKKGTALVKVFQLYRAQEDEVLPRSISLKRSINRQERRGGRRRGRTAIKAGKKASEGQNSSLLEVQEAKAAATPSARSGVKKRRKMMLLSDILASPMMAAKEPAATAVEGNVNVLEEEDSLIEVQVQFQFQEAEGAASESVGLVVDERPKKQQFMGTPKKPPKAAKRRKAAAESTLTRRTAQAENLEAMGPSKLENILDKAFAAAGRSAAAARCKRRHAQARLQHADLATYKATMALRNAQGFGVR
ncbi:uncharacterized protein LOC127805593 [Diospyros lotus]|uniref:uncharacterized protein LOC127805593 n=1 Tax=Diospyros lotus TaxID=55363 RepID=UPI00224E3EB6|nr:uncharacterized protein LOC127805593 [Diospyros lotus]